MTLWSNWNSQLQAVPQKTQYLSFCGITEGLMTTPSATLEKHPQFFAQRKFFPYGASGDGFKS